MKKTLCNTVALGVSLIIVVFAVSCSKQVVQTEKSPVSTPKAEPEVRKAPELSEGQDELAGVYEQIREEEAAIGAAERAFIYENIHFSFNSSLLSDRAQQILKSKANYMHANPDIEITIEGHCDDRGTNIYNLALGAKRAVSVKKYLIALGIGPDRLDTVSYGEDWPMDMGHNEAAWARNRRAQFAIN